MKFKANVAGLAKGLGPAIEVASKAPLKDFEYVDKVGLAVTEDGAVAYAFNGRMSVKNTISDSTINNLDFKFIDEGRVVFNAKELARVLGSFRATEELVVELKDASGEDGGKELIFALAEDEEQFQSLPVYKEDITLPEPASDYDKNLDINRNILLRGINKVFFAVGYENEREQYLYWAIKAKGDTARFVAGSGARFAVLNLQGDSLFSKAADDIMFLMPKEQTPSIQKILTDIEDEMVTIKESKSSDNFHIVIATKSSEIMLMGINANIKYVDENVVMNRTYSCKTIGDVSEWEYAARGTMATFDEQLKKERRPHKAFGYADFGKAVLQVKTKDRMRSCRKVKMLDIINGSGKDTGEFIVSSNFFAEVSAHAEDSKYVQVEFDGADRKCPVLVRYFAADKIADPKDLVNINKSINTRESFTIFFCQLQG